MFKKLLLLLTTLLLVNCTQQAVKPIEPKPITKNTEKPILQIDTGGHKAKIQDITFTPDGKYLVSASNDKTIRVWDWQNETTERIIRGQIGDGSEGKIYAMALSPDGRWLAVGGWMKIKGEFGHHIRLYHFPTGQLKALLKGHNDVVLSLAFAPNSRYLISGSGDYTAMIWDIKAQQRLHVLRGHRDDIYAVAFTPDSQRVVTGSLDHDLRLWQVNNGQPIALLSGHDDKVRAVAVSPDGTIASGSQDYTIRLWDGKTGHFIKQLANQGTKINSLSFSPDGKVLLSSCSSDCANNPESLWSIPSGKQLAKHYEHTNSVFATAISPNGHLAATGGGSNDEIHIWDIKTGKTQQRLQGIGTNTQAVRLSDTKLIWRNTTKAVGWLGGWAGKGSRYQINLSSKNQSITKQKNINRQQFNRTRKQWQNWSLKRQKGGNYGNYAILNIQHNNQTVASIKRGSTDGYAHHAYTFTPNGQQIISGGGNGVLTAYNKQGQKLGNYVGHTSDIWSVAVSPDGQLLASGSADQTVRLWNVNTFENILTLFRGTNEEWVIWTPQGYYVSSIKGDEMIGWHINKGVDKNPDYLTANQLRKHFHRPDIISEAIRLRSAKQAVAQARNTDFDINQLATMQPPEFTVLHPEPDSQVQHKYISLELQLAANKQGLHDIKVYVNGTLAGNPRTGKTALPRRGLRKSLQIGLQQGENHIEVVAKNDIGETRQTLTVYLKHDGALDQKGDLYLLAIGVSQYKDSRLNLQYADDDAHALYQQLKHLGKSKYNKIHATLLADGAKPPTAKNIRKALDTLLNAKENDTSIIFIAGHGENGEDGYYFLSQDATQHNGLWSSSTVLHWSDFQDAIQKTTGRRLLLLDTCHSGAAIKPSLLKEIVDDRIYVMAATDYQSFAQETDELQHGVFAYSLLEGFKGQADMNALSDKKIQLQELAAYVSGKVRQLTNDMQQPVLHIPNGFKDFELVHLD